jgi:4-alpha-glucanotransferase
MLTGMSVGAPPDLLNKGQDWGLTTFDPHRLTQSDFTPFRELLDANMRYAGALRIDHALGLKRVWLVPRGLTARQGAYLKFPFEQLLATIAEASNRNHCVVIGEDLGTVPAGFRETLTDWGLWLYRVLLFERDHDGFLTPQHYHENAVATFSTHDLATYAGWMSAHDLRTKRSIGIDPGESDDERQKARDALQRALARDGKADTDDFRAVARFLADTPSRLVMVSIQDVLGIEEQVNVPGTIHEHPNWRRRLPASIEELAGHAGLRQVAGIFAEAGRHNDRQS